LGTSQNTGWWYLKTILPADTRPSLRQASVRLSQPTCHAGDVTGQVFHCRVLRERPGISVPCGFYACVTPRSSFLTYIPCCLLRLVRVAPHPLLLPLLCSNTILFTTPSLISRILRFDDKHLRSPRLSHEPTDSFSVPSHTESASRAPLRSST
jgi:hypothetical protein